MKFRPLEYFVAAAEELNFHSRRRTSWTFLSRRFSKQIHDLKGELEIELFERKRKGIALTPAGKSFLIDAWQILEDCGASIRKAQRISSRRAAFVSSGTSRMEAFFRARASGQFGAWSPDDPVSNPNLRAPPFPNYVATPSQFWYTLISIRSPGRNSSWRHFLLSDRLNLEICKPLSKRGNKGKETSIESAVALQA
jgi:hypothetical protein